MTRNNTSSTNRLLSTKSIASAAVLGLITSAALGSAASAAQTCAGLKQAIDADGAYLYRYQDKRQPDLPLYVRYVKDEYKCGGGDVLNLRAVPELEDCYVPTCVIGSGEQDR